MLTSCTLKLPCQKNVHFVSDRTDIIDSYAKTALKQGSILTQDMFYSDESLSSRTRTLELTDIRLPENLTTRDLIELRISFPNGEDFVVLTHQKAAYLLQDEAYSYGIALTLSEEDLLRVSSARVDQMLFDGASLYAVVYSADFDAAAEIDYPVNADVFSLMQWDPNIVSRFSVKKEQEKRALLEEHLQTFMQQGTTESLELEDEDYNISQM